MTVACAWPPASLCAGDLELVTANMGRATAVPNGEVVLSPALCVSPARKTVQACDSLTLTASGSTNAIRWFMIESPSGGTLMPLSSTSAVYRAGGSNSCVDILEAWDGDSMFGRSYMNVISPSDVAAAGKAVILAGRLGPTDSLWPTTDYLAGNAYNVLLYRGFSKENIQYLSPVTNRDVDLNGKLDDIDGLSSLADAADTFTNWINNSARLFVYLVDHGADSAGNGYFRLNENEKLYASTLNAWLNDFQNTYNRDVTIVIDCCYAGSILDELSYTGTAKRIVIAAAGTNEPAYFVAGGLVSFSDAFFSGVMMGQDLAQTYQTAQGAMSTYQNAEYCDNGGGHSAEDSYLGATFVAGKDIPQIGLVCGNQLIDSGTTAYLWADDVVSGYAIDKVWCSIIPPSHNPTNPAIPVSDIPELDLVYTNTSGRYQNLYEGFSEQGTYKVVYYAQDIWGSVSLPHQSYVIQSGFDERVIIVAGGETNDVHWPQIHNMANDAYTTMRGRWFRPDRLQYLSSGPAQDVDRDGTNDITGSPDLANLAAAITNWAAGSDRLTVYVIADGSNNLIRLNQTDTLAPSDLDAWLDVYQQSNAQACVILEAPGSGAFLPVLRQSPGQDRICVASAQAGQTSCWADNGLISFSQFFLVNVFNGQSIGDAFLAARKYIQGASGTLRQSPLLDDDGDGAYNSRMDGKVACSRHLGTAFMTGADAPLMATVMPPTTLAGTNALTLWAGAVTDSAGISNVWCVITPPDYGGVGDLPQTSLVWNASTERYEALWADFSKCGTYVLTFLAEDNVGEICSPVQTTVVEEDAYEPDDTSSTASQMELGDVQLHNFHVPGDEDWIRFYAAKGQAHNFYEIDATQIGSNVDLRLDVYYEEPDGTISNLDFWADDFLTGAGVTETVSLDFATWPELPEGFYYIRASASTNSPDAWGPDSDYEVRINSRTGGGLLLAVVVDKLNTSHSPVGATVLVSGQASMALNGGTSVTYPSLPSGTYTVSVPPPPGYVPEESPTAPGQVGNPASYYGNPKNVVIGENGWGSAVFQFVPVVKAQGTVRDAWTGSWLSGAGLEFRALSGYISGLYYRAWPTTNYGSAWVSGADGAWPTNVWLPAVDWDLTVLCNGYSNAIAHRAIVGSSPGTVTNLGTLWLTPLDANGNGVADAWEQQYFPGKTLVLTNDADGDGIDNRHEYLCGTDPTNKASVLRFTEVSATNGLTLSWPVSSGRRYRVLATDALPAGLWPLINGPWEATNGQTIMRWTDTNGGMRTGRFYRIEVPAP